MNCLFFDLGLKNQSLYDKTTHLYGESLLVWQICFELKLSSACFSTQVS